MLNYFDLPLFLIYPGCNKIPNLIINSLIDLSKDIIIIVTVIIPSKLLH